MIYLVTFTISTYFAYLCTKIDKQKNKIWFYVCATMAILVPSILAGLRATSIGTDVEFYVLSDFNNARNNPNIIDFFSLGIYREKLYLLIVYLIARITNNVGWLLFTFEIIIMTCVFIGGYKHKDKLSFPLLMGVFFLLFYNNSFNIVRQYLAATVIFLGIKFLEEKHYFKFLLFVVVAMLFHTTAIIAFIFPLIHYLVTIENEKKKKIYTLLIIITIILGCIFSKPLIGWGIDKGLISNHYSYYVNNDGESNSDIFTVLYGIEVLALLIYSNKIKDKIDSFDYYRMNATMLFIILQISRIIANGDRISFYLNIINIYLIAQLPNIFENKKYKEICYVALALISLAYWVYVYAINNSAETYPYTSIFGNILI